MKKSAKIMILTVLLSFTLFGCGNNETEQEEQIAQEEMDSERGAEESTEESTKEETKEDLAAESEEPETESTDYVDPNEAYQNIVSTLDELVDSEKTYTQAEFEELVSQFFDKIDSIKYHSELGEDAQVLRQTVDLKGDGIKDFFNRLFYNIYGTYGSCTEMGIEVIESNEEELEVEIQYIL